MTPDRSVCSCVPDVRAAEVFSEIFCEAACEGINLVENQNTQTVRIARRAGRVDRA